MLNVSRDKFPEHVAIVMDGNGRWAEKRGKSRNEGHRVGIEKIREMLEICLDLGIGFLTIYAFSCQNWKRPQGEVNYLMNRFESYLDKEGPELRRKGVRLKIIGRKEDLSAKLQKKIEQTMRMTQNNNKLHLNLAIFRSSTPCTSR